MVRNLTENDFLNDSIVLLAGQSALIVIDKEKQKRGEDPVLCAMIGDADEIQFLHRLHKMDPGNLDIRYVTSEIDPNILVGVYDMLDFKTMVRKKLEDVFEFGINPNEDTTIESQLAYMYDCLHIEGMVDPQLFVYNKNPTEYREGYVAPADLFVLFYGHDKPIGSCEDFLNTYREHRTIACFVCDMPVEDKETRVVVSLYPPEDEHDIGHMLISLPGAKNQEEAEAYLSQFMTISGFPA